MVALLYDDGFWLKIALFSKKLVVGIDKYYSFVA